MSVISANSYLLCQKTINFNGISLGLDKAITQLRDNGYLDDLTLDFFMEFAKELCIGIKENCSGGKYCVISSLFYTILSMCDDYQDYLRLRKWVKKVSTPLLLNDAIVIPMHCNQTSHWWLIVICHPHKIFNLMNSSHLRSNSYTKIEESSKGWIICMDSLGGKNIGQHEKRKAIVNILKFLDIERQNNNSYSDLLETGSKPTMVNTTNANTSVTHDKLSETFRSLSNWEIIYSPKNLPFQENNFDCGIYIIEYAHWLFHYGTTIFNSMINRSSLSEVSDTTCLNQNRFSRNWFQNRRAVYTTVLEFMSTNTGWNEEEFLRNKLVEIFDGNTNTSNNNQKVAQENISSLQTRKRFVMSSLNKSYFNK
ncbi:ULP1 like protease with a chlamydin like cysteine protease domain [Cryptosporidium sp. chipmunk genotype I]|uniref:ULP1 like protease with a chlamydin like cysteine protease domain n=1 Tax=Cryptosporidium sp. chipmunk genotype I TaxID=1280935 RepID=UPI003519DFCD|nr:ULP1 like protease with a chlamydin like cysteine protease domain [Cryptosporidium sp. chipmunk genotype I]